MRQRGALHQERPESAPVQVSQHPPQLRLLQRRDARLRERPLAQGLQRRYRPARRRDRRAQTVVQQRFHAVVGGALEQPLRIILAHLPRPGRRLAAQHAGQHLVKLSIHDAQSTPVHRGGTRWRSSLSPALPRSACGVSGTITHAMALRCWKTLASPRTIVTRVDALAYSRHRHVRVYGERCSGVVTRLPPAAFTPPHCGISVAVGPVPLDGTRPETSFGEVSRVGER